MVARPPVAGDAEMTMLIRRAEDVPGRAMEMDGVRDVEMRLLIGREDGAPTFSMRHFTVEPGGHTPRHAHNYEHEVYIVKGAGTVERDGTMHEVRAGDVVFVEPNAVHQFRNDSQDPFEFICLVPASFDCGDGRRAPTPGS